MRRYNRSRVTGQQALSCDILEWFLANEVERRRWAWHYFPLHQMYGVDSSLPRFMTQVHPIRNERDVDFYLQRLSGFPAVFTGTVERLQESERRGVLAPRFSIELTLASMREFIDQPVSENPLYVELLNRVDAIEGFPAQRRERLPGELAESITTYVYPAFETLIAYQEGLLDRARSNDGVWRLPDGEDYYAWIVRSNTTTEPGHHFQVALQQEIRGVQMFRRIVPFTAYAEGWALYAEQLAWEAGFHEDPYDNLGRLQAEQFRAVRLVVDTGMHYKRWSREQAIEYMHAKTGMPLSEVTREIQRYLVIPGQALAYKVGMIKILEQVVQDWVKELAAVH